MYHDLIVPSPLDLNEVLGQIVSVLPLSTQNPAVYHQTSRLIMESMKISITSMWDNMVFGLDFDD